jgi:hypothetical protein
MTASGPQACARAGSDKPRDDSKVARQAHRLIGKHRYFFFAEAWSAPVAYGGLGTPDEHRYFVFAPVWSAAIAAYAGLGVPDELRCFFFAPAGSGPRGCMRSHAAARGVTFSGNPSVMS